MTDDKRLILASSSPYRRALLDRLGLPFECVKPEVDEAARPGETPEQLVLRLARAKAEAVAGSRPGSLVIGSDQVAVLGDRVLGKPGGETAARRQLAAASGQVVRFLTGLCLVAADGSTELAMVPYSVRFRSLNEAQINAYLDREQPFDCAGSFKSEGLGVALFESMEGEDPTALVGLPLIRLCSMLRAAGLDPLAQGIAAGEA
ncbi:MAG: Maf family protein [Halothiobacillaceae bacterium]